MAVFKTDDFVLVDHTDQTKAINFDVSNGTTGNLKTLAVPALFGVNDSLTLAVSNETQLFSANQQFEQTIGIKDVVTGFFLNIDCINAISGNKAITPPDSSGRWVVSEPSPAALLAATRVPYVSSTAGVLTSDAGMTYSASTGLSIQALNVVCYDDAVVCYDDAVVFY